MRRRGFTLIELLIALAIFVFLILLAGPMYADFMGNSQIRNAAENALTGVRYAQTTAIKTNRPVKFVLNPAATTGGWAVYEFDENAGDYFARGIAIVSVDRRRIANDRDACSCRCHASDFQRSRPCHAER